MPGAPRPRREAKSPQRRKSALALRIEGLTFEAIGERLGITRQAAHKLVAAELAAVTIENRAAAAELIEVEVERCRFVVRSMAPKVAKGDPRAALAFLRACERTAHLLGLDAPKRAEVSGPGGRPLYAPDTSPEALYARLQKLTAEALGAPSTMGAEGPVDPEQARLHTRLEAIVAAATSPS